MREHSPLALPQSRLYFIILMKIVSTLFASFVLTAAAGAVEYVTLTSKTLAKAIPSGALVEIVGRRASVADTSIQEVELSFVDGQKGYIEISETVSQSSNPVLNRKYIFSGLANGSLNPR